MPVICKLLMIGNCMWKWWWRLFLLYEVSLKKYYTKHIKDRSLFFVALFPSCNVLNLNKKELEKTITTHIS